MPIIDLNREVFSRRGSPFAISHWSRDVTPGLWLRRIGDGIWPLYRIEATVDGHPVETRIDCDPGRLRLHCADGELEFCLSDEHTVRCRGRGLGLRLVRDDNGYGGVVEAPDGAWRSILGSTKLMLTPHGRTLRVDAPWGPREMWGTLHHRCDHVRFDLVGDGTWELLIERYLSEYEPGGEPPPFDRDVAEARADYERWRSATPTLEGELADAADRAVYVDWSSVVPEDGEFLTPAMLMSKVGMTRCWNWDNAFNAWAMSAIDPAFAWDMFRLHLWHQHPQGALPDGIDINRVEYTYTKPPVHGWILGRMLDQGLDLDERQLREVYESLCAWTRWWLRYRDDDRDGVCQYNHGNDSGWDNATVFDLSMPVESPELGALLVVQMDLLADLAERFGLAIEADAWRESAATTLQALLDHCWDGERFVARRSGDHRLPPAGDCLLPHLAIVLGARLPADIRRATIAALKQEGRFLTAHGLATESVASPLHLECGYWRGPIWAPAMMIAIDGIDRAGDPEFAAELARRFCRTCAREGFAENFSAVAGEALCDPAYTWTSSVFLILARRYLVGEAEPVASGATGDASTDG